MKNQNQIQQGDLILKKLDRLPDGKKKTIASQKCILAHGESGHSHVLEDDEAELIQIGEKMLLTLTKTAIVKHEEHKTVILEPGIWQVGQVREYDYFSEKDRIVSD